MRKHFRPTLRSRTFGRRFSPLAAFGLLVAVVLILGASVVFVLPLGSGTQDNRAISINASYTVASTSPPSAPTVNLTASPDSINAGQSSVLSWASTNASSCSAPWTSSAITSGSQSVSPATTTTYSITCSGVGGSASTSVTVSVASLVGTTSSTLTYAPPGYPSYSGYTTIHVNNATPSWVTGQLNPSTDYRIIIDEPLTNTLLIGGGHNVVIIGGEINKAVVSSHPNPDQTYGMYLVDQTGTIHVEGVYFHGAGLGEGVVTNEGKGATVQLENLRIEVTYPTPSDYSIHPDVFQTWRGPYILRMDHLTGSSTNKAFNFQPFEYGWYLTGAWDVRNTNLATVGPDQSYILWRDNIEDSTQQRFPWWAETNSNFYINPGRAWGWCWPSSQHWQLFTMGVPPTGDYVPSGVAGMNYKSPGYNH